MTDPIHPKFDHHENITYGLARVIYGQRNHGWAVSNGWFLPGCQFTVDRDIAFAYAKLMNRLMGGVEVSA